MNILFLVRGYDGGGIYMFTLQHVKRLRSMGHKVGAIIIGSGKSVQGYEDAFDYTYKEPNLDIGFRGNIKNKAENIFKAYKTGSKHANIISKSTKNKNIDILFLNGLNMVFMSRHLKKQLNNIPTFWYMHGIVNSVLGRTFLNIILPLFNIIPIANSKHTQSSLGNYCKHVIYPGYEPERVLNGNDKYRKKLNIDCNTPVYGIAARISKERAQDIIIRAFIESNAIKKHNAHLIIAGDYINQNYYDKVIKTAGEYLDKNIHIIGRIDDLNNFYSSIDVYINSVIIAEGFGMSVAESLGAGKPVIAYNLGGPSEMIKHNENGWLLTPSDVETYKEAIDISLKEKGRWKGMEIVCQQSAKGFQVETNANKLINIFEEHIKK